MTIASVAIWRLTSRRPVRPARTIADWCRKRPVPEPDPAGRASATLWQGGKPVRTIYGPVADIVDIAAHESDGVLSSILPAGPTRLVAYKFG